mmetsp:Transcript_16982/g.52390  ORF Transcript_16982/g.52390 Transcript_16982/m.52390 type:complete len:220 (+) Transcript_16982:4384-5043(+)
MRSRRLRHDRARRNTRMRRNARSTPKPTRKLEGRSALVGDAATATGSATRSAARVAYVKITSTTLSTTMTASKMLNRSRRYSTGPRPVSFTAISRANMHVKVRLRHSRMYACSSVISYLTVAMAAVLRTMRPAMAYSKEAAPRRRWQAATRGLQPGRRRHGGWGTCLRMSTWRRQYLAHLRAVMSMSVESSCMRKVRASRRRRESSSLRSFSARVTKVS